MSTEHNIGRQGLGHENSGNRDKSNPFITEPVEQLPEYDHERAHPGHQIGETPDFVKTPEIPEQRTAEIVDNDTKNEKGSKKPLWITVGALAAGASVIGAALLGIKNNGKETGAAGPSPSSTPSSSAPAVAGSSSSGEIAPSTGEVKPDSNNYVFSIEGKRYQGVETLIAEEGISVEEYPTYKEVAPAFVERVNRWINSGGTTLDEEQSKDYVSNNKQWQGTTAVADDIEDPAWIRTLTTGQPEVSEWAKNMSDIHKQNLAYQVKTKNDTVPYKRMYVIDERFPVVSNGSEGDSVDAHIYVQMRDNGDKNTMGKLRTTSPGGWDGITTKQEIDPHQVMHLTIDKQMIETPDHKTKMQWKMSRVIVENSQF